MVRRYRKEQDCKERIEWDELHDEELVSAEVAARFLAVSVAFIKKWSGRKFPIYRLGKAARFKIGDLRAYRESCCVINNN